MSIKYGSYVFDEPVLFALWSPPNRTGLYAILIPDKSFRPKPFRVIYFGESGNLSERGFFKSHNKYSCWIREAGSEENLYIAIYLMPDSTPSQRKFIEKLLITQYKPVCNQS